MNMKRIVNAWICLMVDSGKTSLLNRTGTIASGWIIEKMSLLNDFKMTIQRIILMEQLVDPALPPMNMAKSMRYWIGRSNKV